MATLGVNNYPFKSQPNLFFCLFVCVIIANIYINWFSGKTWGCILHLGKVTPCVEYVLPPLFHKMYLGGIFYTISCTPYYQIFSVIVTSFREDISHYHFGKLKVLGIKNSMED